MFTMGMAWHLNLPQVGQSFRVSGPEDVKVLERLAASGSLEGDVLLDACEWKVRRVLEGGWVLQGGQAYREANRWWATCSSTCMGLACHVWRRHCLSTRVWLSGGRVLL